MLLARRRGPLALAGARDADPRSIGRRAVGLRQVAAGGAGTDTLAGNDLLYLPLRAPMRTRGVLVIEPENPRLMLVPEQRRHLDTFAALIAIALERVHYVEVAQQALLHMESERLRNSLLAPCRMTCARRLPRCRGSADR